MEHEQSTSHDMKSHTKEPERGKPSGMKQDTNHYVRLAMMLAASFVAMYVLMYAMVNVADNAVPNVNQAYMAGLMTAPMLILELVLMDSMYSNKTANKILLVVGLIALGMFWWAIRSQAVVRDNQFLRSMIPHHAGAILMCENAELRDPELLSLCENILKSQRSEIDFMQKKLGR
jgi:uncharacterized protein (DUF305 family)